MSIGSRGAVALRISNRPFVTLAGYSVLRQ